MGLLNSVRRLGRRGSNPPPAGVKPAPPASPPEDWSDPAKRVTDLAAQSGLSPQDWAKAFNAPGNKPAAPSAPPTKPQPTGGRLIYTDRDPGPVEVPSDELMERWERAEGRRQAQSLQLPPPGADPVATKDDLTRLWLEAGTFDDFGRALYQRGRADERTAFLRALGVLP
jgi:hypothetical protein